MRSSSATPVMRARKTTSSGRFSCKHAESRAALYDAYDSVDRLRDYQRGTLATGGVSISTPISLPGTDTERNYTLDGLGNWKSTEYTPVGGSDTTELRRHNYVNQVTRFATTPVLYDHGANTDGIKGNGNIVNDGTRSYQYDALNRLIQVWKTPATPVIIAAYAYDAFGRRIQKAVSNGGVTGTVATGTTNYLYAANQCVEEQSGGSATRQCVWGRYIDELIQMKTYAETGSQPLVAGAYYLLSDLLYRSTALTDSEGDIVEAYDTDAYGNTLIYSAAGTGGWFSDDDVTSDQPACEYIFTGREYDPETKIYNYRGRYYESSLGRFLSKDALGYSDSPNPYAIARSGPARFLDPFGESVSEAYDWCCDKLEAGVSWILTGTANPSKEMANAANLGYVQGWGDLGSLSQLTGIVPYNDPDDVASLIDPEGNRSVGQLIFAGHWHADPSSIVPAVDSFRAQAATQWDCWRNCMKELNQYGAGAASGAVGGNFWDINAGYKPLTKALLSPKTFADLMKTAGRPGDLLDGRNYARFRTIRAGRAFDSGNIAKYEELIAERMELRQLSSLARRCRYSKNAIKGIVVTESIMSTLCAAKCGIQSPQSPNLPIYSPPSNPASH